MRGTTQREGTSDSELHRCCQTHCQATVQVQNIIAMLQTEMFLDFEGGEVYGSYLATILTPFKFLVSYSTK